MRTVPIVIFLHMKTERQIPWESRGKTGDTSFLLLWVAVLVMAVLLGIIMLVIYRKNLDKKDEKDRE
jgi:heme/copper-type cytochrome/quinol oxidase subunit 4